VARKEEDSGESCGGGRPESSTWELQAAGGGAGVAATASSGERWLGQTAGRRGRTGRSQREAGERRGRCWGGTWPGAERRCGEVHGTWPAKRRRRAAEKQRRGGER
jgi:hypothetical protein